MNVLAACDYTDAMTDPWCYPAPTHPDPMTATLDALTHPLAVLDDATRLQGVFVVAFWVAVIWLIYTFARGVIRASREAPDDADETSTDPEEADAP